MFYPDFSKTTICIHPVKDTADCCIFAPSPWLVRFLGLAKIRSSQICSTELFSNQKCMSEGIPLLM